MNTLKNARRALLPLLAAAALFAMTHDKKAAAQTPPPTPAKQWSLADVLIRNTVGAVKHDLEELAGEFPQQLARFGEAEVDDDSLRYAAGAVQLGVEFRHPLAPEEARSLDGTWRVYRLKDGKLLGARSHASGLGGEDTPSFARRAFGIIRAAEAQLADHLGADTRGSTRDLGAEQFAGRLEEGKLYRAEITYDRRSWEWVTVVPLSMPHHHFGRIEWLNVGHFPGLYFNRPPDARVEVVFQVVRRQVLRRAERTWTASYECRVLGVEGGGPPRAEHLALVAACKSVRATGKRSLSLYFTFDVRRVVKGRFDEREFTVELAGTTANALLGALGLADRPWGERVECAHGKELELTFEVPAGGQTTGRPGLLQEFRLIE